MSLAAATSPSVSVPGTLPLHLRGAVPVSDPDSLDEVQRVVVALKLRDSADLEQLLQAQQEPTSPEFQHWLSPAQFTARFGPSPSTVSAVKDWATTRGLAVTDVSPNRTLVTLAGTRRAVGAAFDTALGQQRLNGVTYVTPTSVAKLPQKLSSTTAAVLGLTTYPTFAHPDSAPYQPYGRAAYRPADFAKIYQAPAATTGTGQTAAVITSGDLRRVATDLAVFQARNRLPRVRLTVVNTTKTSTDTSGADEYDLDTQYTTGFAPGLRSLVAYNADTLGDIHPLNRFVTERRAKTASASYGGCEALNALTGTVAADDQVFRQAMAQGQTLFVSSGDEGSSCSVLLNTGAPVGVTDVEYPASSAYVVAVGGTSLTGKTTQPLREISWVGGGGGYSNVERAQPWQRSEGTYVRALGRGVPDVSLDADPNSGYAVVVAGKETVIGGTSASAPAWNGIWARVLQRHPKLGFAAPVLYRTRSAFTDITVGSNGLFQASSGYDLTTGLGSAKISQLVTSAR